VRAQIPAGTYYVGQEIELRVGVIAAGERPRITLPPIDGAEVTPQGTDLRPLTSSAIGDEVNERNLYVARFRILPRRAGELLVPPVVARLDGRSGASPPVRVAVQGVPVAGRPSPFLGGVGTFEVAAEASPAKLRLGENLEYRILMSGPAARGVTGAPDLARFDRVPLGLRIEPLPDEVVPDPPSRVFRYRVRPTRAGAAVLPPVPLASFDPKTARFVTKVTPGVSLDVTDIPAFDVSTMSYAPAPSDSPVGIGRAGRATVWLVGGGCLTLATAWLVWWIARTLRRRKAAAGRFAARAGRNLDASLPAAELARRITDALTTYLKLATERPAGALTPDEARRAITLVADSPELAERAARLVARCDQAQFSGAEPTVEELIHEARRLLSVLSATRGAEE
jgi:hypothetical protein